MTPIVNGIKEEFTDRVQFEILNAEDGAAGQRAFEALSLPGHPAILIFSPDGEEVYRALGIVEADVLRAALRSSLDNS